MAQAVRDDRRIEPSPIAPKSYVVQIIPPAEIEREAGAMENLLQSFSLSEPFTLELCGEPKQQRFLLRAGSTSALRTLCQQILAQYPQAQLRRIASANDPLLLRPGESAMVGDLGLRAATWLPIKTFWNEEMTQTGTDPVVSLLAAMEPTSRGERIICQVALVSAPDTWGQSYKRKAIESPLDQERKEHQQQQGQQRSTSTSAGPDMRTILVGMILLMVGGRATSGILSMSGKSSRS